MTENKTKEIQYTYLFEKKLEDPGTTLGPMMRNVWNRDPKRLLFVLSRYKFVSKMLSGKNKVLEIGCGDGWASRIVKQTVKELTLSDFDPMFINYAKSQNNRNWNMNYQILDLTQSPSTKPYDAIYLIDVFEHINPKVEKDFIFNITQSLASDGTVIIGIPSLESQTLIPKEKRDPGHVNCKTGDQLFNTLNEFFNNVFIYSMNDEIVHTGYNKMANYLFALCCNPIKR